jgi:hypothetical protein
MIHSRHPRFFGPPQVRAPLFRDGDEGGVALRTGVSATLPGQLSSIGAGGGVRLALGDGAEDAYLEPGAGGGVSIFLAILYRYLRPDGESLYLRPDGESLYFRP